jgi:hypothetical protein
MARIEIWASVAVARSCMSPETRVSQAPGKISAAIPSRLSSGQKEVVGNFWFGKGTADEPANQLYCPSAFRVKEQGTKGLKWGEMEFHRQDDIDSQSSEIWRKPQ